ncbi:MAG TPA: TetR/AcrR family transcriptional regulator [Dyella sp.]|uniref:TetR/AcrR family transcriptional regulator n=1 Tax=Dyella sp. TaxID=1869338 RepID=UPI002BA9C49D|nr:TetR/AcrR family transcriptional regulator [Dyella sp.]HTV86917.1 TetR/AcrR family transcriptional regulator [Dyella sp.]
MRYEKGHKEATRRRIIDVAGERFRKEGIAAVGVANLMSDIGLTQGGFYNHFASKEDLVREALATGLEATRERLRKSSGQSQDVRLQDLLDSYLSARHRDNVGRGCMLTTLAIEAGRCEGPVREQLTDGIGEMVKLVGSVLDPSLKPAQREMDATAVVASMVGAMIMARATDDAQMSERFLQAGRRAALAAVQSAAS